MTVKGNLDICRSYLGYREHGINYTKFGKEFGMDGEPWCDMFLSVCGNHAGEKAAVGWFAGTEAHEAWFNKKKRLTRSRNHVERGHLVFWDWNKNGTPNHIEIIETVSINKTGQVTGVTTIGGNTGPGSSYVYRQHRSMTYFLSAGMPLYKNWTTAWPGILLVRGSNNAAVGRMQKKLGGLTVDHDFGPKTLARVKDFQKAHHLTVDGQVGLKTWGALF